MLEWFFKFLYVNSALFIVILIWYYISQWIKPSKYILAAAELGFLGSNNINGEKIGMKDQQEALLKLFHLAGYFNLPNLWRDLNSIGEVKTPEKVFDHLSTVVKYSNGDQSDPHKFNAKYLRENLFKTDVIDLEDVFDLILYISQHAFNRNIGQERDELVPSEWMKIYSEIYFEEVRKLGLIDRKSPSLNEYDGCWIAGASRVGLARRMIDFNYQIVSRNIQINGEILVLAGQRELTAKLDGISPTIKHKLFEIFSNNIDLPLSLDDDDTRIEEGKSYLIDLAQSHNIKLNTSKPFIEYQSKENCPPGRFPKRIYANYHPSENRKLTETLMSEEMLRTFANPFLNQINIVDTLSSKENRPTTASTAQDATKRLIQRISNGEYGEKKKFVILFCTNNPYIERQTLTTQQQVNQVLKDSQYRIEIEGCGCSSKQQLPVIHSELAALIAEKWIVQSKNKSTPTKRIIHHLLFQTRNKDAVIPDLPKSQTNSS